MTCKLYVIFEFLQKWSPHFPYFFFKIKQIHALRLKWWHDKYGFALYNRGIIKTLAEIIMRRCHKAQLIKKTYVLLCTHSSLVKNSETTSFSAKQWLASEEQLLHSTVTSNPLRGRKYFHSSMRSLSSLWVKAILSCVPNDIFLMVYMNAVHLLCGGLVSTLSGVDPNRTLTGSGNGFVSATSSSTAFFFIGELQTDGKTSRDNTCKPKRTLQH